MGERAKLTAPPGGISLSQVNSPFSTLRSQISGSKKPLVMASTNGGQRLTVFSSCSLIALNATGGIALSQSGRPSAAGTGGGSTPSSSAGQRNLSVIGLSLLDIRFCSAAAVLAGLAAPKRKAKAGGGDGGIRTLDRALQPYNGLANRRLQPLGHVSVEADMPDATAGRKRQIQIQARNHPRGFV